MPCVRACSFVRARTLQPHTVVTSDLRLDSVHIRFLAWGQRGFPGGFPEGFRGFPEASQGFPGVSACTPPIRVPAFRAGEILPFIKLKGNTQIHTSAPACQGWLQCCQSPDTPRIPDPSTALEFYHSLCSQFAAHPNSQF